MRPRIIQCCCWSGCSRDSVPAACETIPCLGSWPAVPSELPSRLKCLASLLPPAAEGGCAQLHSLVACGDARSARGRSEAQATERVWFRRRRRRARGVPSRHVPDTFRARLAIRANRPLLHANTRRFYIRPHRGWFPNRHPPKFFLRKEKCLQHFPEARSWWCIPPFRGV